jgi:hypothetical protein
MRNQRPAKIQGRAMFSLTIWFQGSRSSNKRFDCHRVQVSRTAHSAVHRQSRRLVNDLLAAARGACTAYQGSISCGHALLVRLRMEAAAALGLTRLASLLAAFLAECICVDPRGPVAGRYASSRAGPVIRHGAQAAAQRIEQNRATQGGCGVRDRRREGEDLSCQQKQRRADSADHNRTGRVVQSPLKHFAPLCAPGALCTIQG